MRLALRLVMRLYGSDLVYIHDAGFRDYALGATPGLLGILRRSRVQEGFVIDLGCGSGRWARELNRHGYQVLGIDQSPAFLELARRIAPGSEFRQASLWTARLPQCDAITAIGECLNYGDEARDLARLFTRCYAALRSGGVLIFDAAGPSRFSPEGQRRRWTEGRDWALLVEYEANRAKQVLTRRIVSFRKLGSTYRRAEEIHRLRLFEPGDLLAALSSAGFRAEQVDRFGRFRLPAGIHGFIARKNELSAIPCAAAR